jgi:hypothetical protein
MNKTKNKKEKSEQKFVSDFLPQGNDLAMVRVNIRTKGNVQLKCHELFPPGSFHG